MLPNKAIKSIMRQKQIINHFLNNQHLRLRQINNNSGVFLNDLALSAIKGKICKFIYVNSKGTVFG